MKILIFVFSTLCIFFMCSFSTQKTYNENNNLQISEIYSQREFEKEKNNADYDFQEELDKIFEDFVKLLPDGAPKNTDELLGFDGISSTFGYIGSLLSDEKNVKNALLIVFVGMLLSISELFSKELKDAASVSKGAACVCLAMPIFLIIKDLLLSVSVSIESGSDFFSGVIPLISSVVAIGGSVGAAGASLCAMGVSLGFVSGVLSQSILPAASFIFVLSMMSSFDTGNVTTGISKSFRDLFNFLIGISSLVVVATLAAQTVITVNADNLAIKSAKYAISGMIPVVGSTVSGALTALISGVKLLSSSIGVLSVAALLSVTSGPLILLLFYRFCLWICIVLASFSDAAYAQKFFASLRSALDTIIAVLASSLLVYILEIIIVTGSIRSVL